MADNAIAIDVGEQVPECQPAPAAGKRPCHELDRALTAASCNNVSPAEQRMKLRRRYAGTGLRVGVDTHE